MIIKGVLIEVGGKMDFLCLSSKENDYFNNTLLHLRHRMVDAKKYRNFVNTLFTDCGELVKLQYSPHLSHFSASFEEEKRTEIVGNFVLLGL